MNDCVLVSVLTILLFFVKIDFLFFHLFSFAQFLLLLGKLFGPCYDIDASFSATDKRFVANYVFFPEFCKTIFYYMFGFLYHCGMIMWSIWHCMFGWSVFELLV